MKHCDVVLDPDVVRCFNHLTLVRNKSLIFHSSSTFIVDITELL